MEKNASLNDLYEDDESSKNEEADKPEIQVSE